MRKKLIQGHILSTDGAALKFLNCIAHVLKIFPLHFASVWVVVFLFWCLKCRLKIIWKSYAIFFWILKSFVWMLAGRWSREQPISRFYLHFISGAGNIYCTWQHGSTCQEFRWWEVGYCLWVDCSRWEATWKCLHQDHGETFSGRPWWRHTGICRDDEEEDFNACSLDVWWTKWAPL